MKGKAAYLLLLLGSTLLAAIGQLFFKFAFSSQSSLILWIVAGMIVYIASTVLYFVVLSRVHLSWAYGIGGLSYVFATIFAYYILAESIPTLRWIGVGVIFLGVLLIGLS